MCCAGLSYDMPHMFSTTMWCERPMPSVKRPFVAACTRHRLLRHRERVARVRRDDRRAHLDARRARPGDRDDRHRRRRRRSGRTTRRRSRPFSSCDDWSTIASDRRCRRRRCMSPMRIATAPSGTRSARRSTSAGRSCCVQCPAPGSITTLRRFGTMLLHRLDAGRVHGDHAVLLAGDEERRLRDLRARRAAAAPPSRGPCCGSG